MLGVLMLGGLYVALRDADATSLPSDANGGSTDAPTPPPKPLPVEGDDYRVEEVAKGDQNNIYLLESRRGVLYDDGSGGYSWEQSGYIRGDFPTGFVMAPTGLGGTITFEINETLYENVIVYKTEQEAIDADKKEEPKPDDPQKQPDGEEKPTLPSLPTRPDYGLGGGVGSYFGGGY
jgi:hypothetical protein